MKLGLINSAFAQAGQGTRFGLEKTKEIGFDTVDIFADPLDIDQTEVDLIKRSCTELLLPIKSVCCVAIGLIDFNPSVQRFHLDRCKKYIDLCVDLSCDNLLLVVGEYIWNREVIPARGAMGNRRSELPDPWQLCERTRSRDCFRA